MDNKRTVTSFPDDELIDILDKAKPVQYQLALLTSNYDPYSKSMEEQSQYIERLEASAKIGKALRKTEKWDKKSSHKKKGTEKASNLSNHDENTKNAKFAKDIVIQKINALKTPKMHQKYLLVTKMPKKKT